MSLRDDVMIAFSKTPRPRDEALTSCNCDECRWEIARFRGKKWTRLNLDDFGAEDGGANVAMLTPAAFHYFLPGLILLALDHPEVEEEMLSEIIQRFAVSDAEGHAAQSQVEQVVKRLTGRQRQVLVNLLQQTRNSVPHVPVIWDAVIRTLVGGVVSPYSQEFVDRWIVETYARTSKVAKKPAHRSG